MGLFGRDAPRKTESVKGVVQRIAHSHAGGLCHIMIQDQAEPLSIEVDDDCAALALTQAGDRVRMELDKNELVGFVNETRGLWLRA